MIEDRVQSSARMYGLYGLCIHSFWALPGPAGSGAANIQITEGPASSFSAAAREAPVENGRWFHQASLKNGLTYLRWSELFEFLVSTDGRRIIGRPLSGTSGEALRTYLLGQVLSFALLKQGIEPLHSTVIVIDGVAVGLCGDCGYGKSSLAGSFLQAGHRL